MSRQTISRDLKEFGVGDKGQSKAVLHKILWQLQAKKWAIEASNRSAMGHHVHYFALPYTKNEGRFAGHANRVRRRRCATGKLG